MQLLEYLKIYSGYDGIEDTVINTTVDYDEQTMKNIIFLISSKQYKVRMSDLLAEVYKLSFVSYGVLYNISRMYTGNNSSPGLNMFFQEIADVLYTDKYCNMAKFAYLLTSKDQTKTELNVVIPSDAKAKNTADEVLTIIQRVQPEGLLYMLKILHKYWYMKR